MARVQTVMEESTRDSNSGVDSLVRSLDALDLLSQPTASPAAAADTILQSPAPPGSNLSAFSPLTAHGIVPDLGSNARSNSPSHVDSAGTPVHAAIAPRCRLAQAQASFGTQGLSNTPSQHRTPIVCRAQSPSSSSPGRLSPSMMRSIRRYVCLTCCSFGHHVEQWKICVLLA